MVGCFGLSGYVVILIVSSSGSVFVGLSVWILGIVLVDLRRFRIVKLCVGVSIFYVLKYKLNNRVFRRFFFYVYF